MPESPEESRGLGDTVAKFTKRTRLDRLSGSSCGCARRQAALNRRFPYNKRQAIVPDDRPSDAPSPTSRARSKLSRNNYRNIDGKMFKRWKKYGSSSADLAIARRDADILRKNPSGDGRHTYARILKFKDGYHVFTWRSSNASARRGAKSSGPDDKPTSGMVDGVMTKFHRRRAR